MSTILELLDSGSHVLASDDLYGGTFRLFERVRRRSAGLDFTFVDMADPAAVERAVRPNTRMLWVETPSNPMLKLIDLAAVAGIARHRGLLAVADNTFATPYLQRPIEYGFDLVVHSATKYLNGHSDVIGGIAVVRDQDLGDRLGFLQNAVGAVAGPFDAFLVLRGLKTLHLRMDRHCANGLAIARYLESAPARRTGYLSRTLIASAARTGATPDASIWRHGYGRAQRRPGLHAPCSRKLPGIRACGKPWGRRKPHRAPRHHDPRFCSRRTAP